VAVKLAKFKKNIARRYSPSCPRGAQKVFIFLNTTSYLLVIICGSSRHVSLKPEVKVIIMPVPDSQVTVSVMNVLAQHEQTSRAIGLLVSPMTGKWPSQIST
jgi:hypothetical protein